jgi:hypothetical protein
MGNAAGDVFNVCCGWERMTNSVNARERSRWHHPPPCCQRVASLNSQRVRAARGNRLTDMRSTCSIVC